MAKFVSKEMISKAREMDLYSYMELFEPDNLFKVSNEYHLHEHDSVVISNGLWVQKSTGIGGRTALDYLVKVRGLSFQDAVEQLSGMAAEDRTYKPNPVQPQDRSFQLPPKNKDNTRIITYLKSRGISENVIRHCIELGVIYESGVYHNVVFIGMNYDGSIPRYAFQRGCGSNFKGEAEGSDKRFVFRLECPESTTVHLFEAAIDALSFATLLEQRGQDWRQTNLLSLGGVASRKNQGLPLALETYLNHRRTKKIILHLDNDAAGRDATVSITAAIQVGIDVRDSPPPFGKDVNDFLCQTAGIPQPHSGKKSRDSPNA